MKELPIDLYIEKITDHLIQKQEPLLLTAEPGSGKTTRLPALLTLKLLQNQILSSSDSLLNSDVNSKLNLKKIIIIVPKRISAVSAADRIAEEMGLKYHWLLGQEVGYQVRFEFRSNENTPLIFMTEGLFLKKATHEIFWNSIHTLILDEFHERSANLDLILGLAFEKCVLEEKIKLLVMSATLNTESLKKYFGKCSHIDIKTQKHQLNLIYSDKQQHLKCDELFWMELKKTISQALKSTQKDILVFLPGQSEILKAQKILIPLYPQIKIEVLYGSLSLSEQKRIIQGGHDSVQRIILSTNIAETSLTLKGVNTVIDSGLERTITRDLKTGLTGLVTSRVSQFSAVQRAGRAAREWDGTCYRMWHKIDEASMKEQKEPEILKSKLIDEVFTLIHLNYQKPSQFMWLTPPKEKDLQLVIKKLLKWNLISPLNLNSEPLDLIPELNQAYRVTPESQKLSEIPLDIEKAVLFYELLKWQPVEQVCHFITWIESPKLNQLLSQDPKSYGIIKMSEPTFVEPTPFDVIMAAPLTDAQDQKIFQQLLKIGHEINKVLAKETCNSVDKEMKKQNSTQSTDKNFSISLFKVYRDFFTEWIAKVKSPEHALTFNGRGLEPENLFRFKDSDFILLLAGRETQSQSSQISAFAGYSKKIALEFFKEKSERVQKIEFNSQNQEFLKTDQLVFEDLILMDYGTQKVSKKELNTIWKTYFSQNPALDLFHLHIDFLDYYHKLLFINKNPSFFKSHLQSSKYFSENTLNIDQILIDLKSVILNTLSEFNEFQSCHLLSMSYALEDSELMSLLEELPHSIIIENGKKFKINYTDDKAPLISLKIQEAMIWKETPKIFHNSIELTLELLAPNMRPTQITKNLAQFWKSSYHDIKKELKGRYPKHRWPDEV